MKKLEERYEDFKKLKASEQVEFAKKNPNQICSIIWYLEGCIRAYESREV